MKNLEFSIFNWAFVFSISSSWGFFPWGSDSKVRVQGKDCKKEYFFSIEKLLYEEPGFNAYQIIFWKFCLLFGTYRPSKQRKEDFQNKIGILILRMKIANSSKDNPFSIKNYENYEQEDIDSICWGLVEEGLVESDKQNFWLSEKGYEFAEKLARNVVSTEIVK